MNSPYKGPVTQKMFPFGDVIMELVLSLVPDSPREPRTLAIMANI